MKTEIKHSALRIPHSAFTSGFTLVEAMMALAIMSLAAFALLTAASRCVAAAKNTKDFHDSISILDQAWLEHPLIMTNEVFENEVEPTEYGEFGQYIFSRSVERMDEEDDKDMFIVHTRVSWKSKSRDKFEEVVTYIYSTNYPDYEH